jgi:hypothetical protein
MKNKIENEVMGRKTKDAGKRRKEKRKKKKTFYYVANSATSKTFLLM